MFRGSGNDSQSRRVCTIDTADAAELFDILFTLREAVFRQSAPLRGRALDNRPTSSQSSKTLSGILPKPFSGIPPKPFSGNKSYSDNVHRALDTVATGQSISKDLSRHPTIRIDRRKEATATRFEKGKALNP